MRIIALFGPTGVGKTSLAIALAQGLRLRGEDPVAVSADAMQIYRGIEILSGAPTAAEQAQLEHRLVSVLPIGQTCSAGRYAELAHAEIDALLADGRRPIVVGGTGLYLRAALAELTLRPVADPEVRLRLQGELEVAGTPAMHERLAALAPWAALEIDLNDRSRVLRALELHEAGVLSPRDTPSELWSEDLRHPTLLIGLVMERGALYEAIDARVDAMLAQGAREEVALAEHEGASATARRALGFSELLAGDVDGMKRRTRNYAKRQLTWMRKLAGVHTLDVTGRSAGVVAQEILDSWPL
jgi:tRNA dimethylallyltransferase